uniref:peptidylprolyl isomerase n=1 Tax=Mastacembelus armatus TaxID=205130 RepID=A0A3Q3SNQ0_9TELE
AEEFFSHMQTDFSSSSLAKLASLFGLDHESSQGNESFQYTAPKQPRKSTNPAPAVLFATAVQAFRYINGQYVKQGKLGTAVLGNHTTKEYKLLLYLSQQKQVTAAKIHVGFVFTVQPNNYCTFYDNQRQNWSLMFESEKALSNFCKEVCLAKANSAASLDAVVAQDLSLGEGQGVENGDSLEVVYTGWLLQNHTIGQMFDSNQNKDKLLRLKIGAGKVIKGWEEGMLGMKKAGSRLIVIPPHLAYGSKEIPNRIPANSTLIFEAELRRVKFSKDTGSDRASPSFRDSAAPSPAPSPAPSVENLAPDPAVQVITSGPGRPGDPPLRAKSNSLSEQLAVSIITNPDATKAKLISRMAKMGQPMLPFLTGVASQPESSDSEFNVLNSIVLPAAYAHPHTPSCSALLPAMTTVAPQPGLPGLILPFDGAIFSAAATCSVRDFVFDSSGETVRTHKAYSFVLSFPPGSSDVTSFLMTEARQHNTEIRLAVGKVADKVDQLASKVDDLQRQGSLPMGVSSMSMETSMIVHNIQRIVQENECLKKEVFEKSSRIEEQNRKIGELINQSQRYMEQSNLLLEQRNDSLKSSSEQNQARLLQAEQDKVRLTEDLASSTARLSQLQLEVSAHQQKAAELQSKLNSVVQENESHYQRITTLETQLEELKEAADRAQAQYRSEKQRRKEMEQRVNNMEEELQDLKTDKEGLERTLLERKKKWQAEHQHRDEEVEELRKSSQQELDSLRAQLRRARTNTDNTASEQLSQLQAELEEEWKGKCEQMLACAKKQSSRELAELTEQRDALQDKLAQLQEKYTSLEPQGVAVRETLKRRVAELEKKLAQQESSGDTAAEVKRVMNGVFHSLRGEFDLSESYSGQAVLGVIVTTIKNVTLQLEKEKEVEEEEEGESGDEKQRVEKSLESVHVNGEREVKEKETKEHVAKLETHQVSENEQNWEAAAAEEKRITVSDTVTQSQAESLQATDLHPVSVTELKPQETTSAESEVQQEPGEHSTHETSSEQNDTNKSEYSDDGPDVNSLSEDGRETVSERNAIVSTQKDKESVDEGEHVEEMIADSWKSVGPPANPPPPPDPLQNSLGEDKR